MRYFRTFYNGTDYHGWQVQPNAITVQLFWIKRFQSCSKTNHYNGAGRTDTGVHAAKMVAHFDFNTSIDLDDLTTINSLPKRYCSTPNSASEG